MDNELTHNMEVTLKRGFFDWSTIFQNKKLESPDGKDEPLELGKLLARFPAKWTGVVLPFIFIVLYFIGIFVFTQSNIIRAPFH